jgi:ABC-2 type transport system permease protein
MKGLVTIYRRELAGLFVAPLAWILLTISMWLTGWLFVTVLKQSGGDVNYANRFVAGQSMVFWALMIFLPPLLTMRMISEESRNGLLEFLLTSPVSDAAVVLGKFFAAWTFMALFWSCNLAYGAVLHGLGAPPDWPPVLGGYLGSVLLSGLFCSVGLFVSSITNTPILAAFGALCGSIAMIALPWIVGLFDSVWLTEEVASVDIMRNFQRTFLVGVIDTQVLVFFGAWTTFFLFLASRGVEAKRWK